MINNRIFKTIMEEIHSEYDVFCEKRQQHGMSKVPNRTEVEHAERCMATIAASHRTRQYQMMPKTI